MKTTKYAFIFLLLSFVFTSVFAQVEKKREAKVDKKTEINKTNSIDAVGNKIEFKNETTNPILTITDEGSNAGSILIPQGPTLTDPNDDDKLYNVGGTLHWNGDAVGTNGSAGGWTHSGIYIYNTTLTNNVGIGTDSPQSLLSVGGVGTSSASIYGKTTTGTGVYGYATSSGSGISGVSNNGGVGVNGTNYGANGSGVSGTANGEYGTAVSGYASGAKGFAGYFIGRGYFSGNVGIGNVNIVTTPPLTELHIFDGNNDGNTVLRLQSYLSGENTLIEFYESTDKALGIEYNGADNNLYFNDLTQPTPLARVTFERSGDVGIAIRNPTFRLHVVDNSTEEVAMFDNQNEGTDSDGISIQAGAIANPGADVDYIVFRDGDGDPIATIEGNGGGVAYTTTSDARLKTKIQEYSNALNVLSRIGIRKYERINNPGNEEIGVIAQELQKVYPQAVSGSPDSDVKTDPMMVDYSKLTPLLVKAVQEQQGIIKTQDSSIKTQDKRIKELEDKLSKIESLLDGKRFTSVSK